MARAPQQAQLPPNSLTRVTSGLIGGSSIRSYTCCGVCCSTGNAAAQWGQASSLASTMRSGLGSSARPTPGRLLRGGFSPAGRSGFWPLAGGSDELSGVFCGRSNAANRFSSSAMRARAAFSCPTNGNSERISVSFSAWLSVLRSVSGVTPMLNRVARDRVNHHSQPAKRERHPALSGRGVTQVSNYEILAMLGNDGFIAKVERRYVFRSGLVCQYWREY